MIRMSGRSSPMKDTCSRPMPSSVARRSTQASLSPTPTHERTPRSEEHTSELQSLMRISYAVFCLKKKKKKKYKNATDKIIIYNQTQQLRNTTRQQETAVIIQNT